MVTLRQAQGEPALQQVMVQRMVDGNGFDWKDQQSGSSFCSSFGEMVVYAVIQHNIPKLVGLFLVLVAPIMKKIINPILICSI